MAGGLYPVMHAPFSSTPARSDDTANLASIIGPIDLLIGMVLGMDFLGKVYLMLMLKLILYLMIMKIENTY